MMKKALLTHYVQQELFGTDLDRHDKHADGEHEGGW